MQAVDADQRRARARGTPAEEYEILGIEEGGPWSVDPEDPLMGQELTTGEEESLDRVVAVVGARSQAEAQAVALAATVGCGLVEEAATDDTPHSRWTPAYFQHDVRPQVHL